MIPLVDRMTMQTLESSSFIQVDSLLARIGKTPLIRLARIARNPRVRLYAKAEWYNPGGSVKDRPVLNMILHAVRSGALISGRTIIDATSGNSGIAYAMLGATMGYPAELVMPANVGAERKRMIEAFGATITYSDPLEGTDGSRNLVRTIVSHAPDRYFYPDQYNNPANWMAHFETTGREILQQTDSAVTHFVCGLGTAGTFTGTARRLKLAVPGIRTISVQPDGPMHGLEGLKHLPTAWVPGIYDQSLVDDNEEVSTEDAYGMLKRLAREEGLLVGISSGAAALAALRVAERLEEGVVVTVFPDSASKYLSERFWER